jgi:hypothetical protein
VALDYFVSDRIKIVTNFNMTYTDNQKNYSDLLGSAYRKMPNLSIYEEDIYGNSTGEFYHMLPTSSSQLSDQRGIVNPIALANQAYRNESTINISPEFQLKYNFLGMKPDQTQFNYEGRVTFNIFNSDNEGFYPNSLVTAGWANSNANNKSDAANKSQAVNTKHTLTLNLILIIRITPS